MCRRKDTPVGSSILRLIIIAVKQHQKTTTTALKLGGKKTKKKKKNVAARPSPKLYSHTWTHTHTHTQSQFFGLWNAEVSYCFFVPFISEFHPPSTSREIDLSSRHTTTTRKGNFKVFFSSLFLKGRLSLRLCAHLHLILM